MKVFIQAGKDGHCINHHAFAAYEGFKQLGWEIVFFKDSDLITDPLPENVVVGNISEVHKMLQRQGFPVPPPLDYPITLKNFLGRAIWRSSLHKFVAEKQFNVFIKPAHRSKTFTGKLITTEKDLIGCYDYLNDIDIWCAAPIKFVAEWRCFIRYGKILDVRPYRGSWTHYLDTSIVMQAVEAYIDGPNAFALDFGLTVDGRTLLVEANDGYSLGAYGLPVLDYAKLLSARWAEMTNTTDYAFF